MSKDDVMQVNFSNYCFNFLVLDFLLSIAEIFHDFFTFTSPFEWLCIHYKCRITVDLGCGWCIFTISPQNMPG